MTIIATIPFCSVAVLAWHHPAMVAEPKDNREVVDIGKLNEELKTTVAKIDRLRADIDAIVAEIEGEEAGA